VTRSRPAATVLAVVPVALALAAAPTAAQRPADPALRPGAVVDSVRAASDSTQRFAIYLPSTYTADRAWPVLFLMDPRGRALVPLERFRAAAERRGYVVLSSYNTLSDGAIAPNDAALDAMLVTAQDRLAVDTARLYLGGFSGTARLAWGYAAQLDGHIAGVIGVGAGLPSADFLVRQSATGGLRAAFFGGAGTTDFNYEEVRALDRRLDQFGITHHVELFDGGHEWPPDAVCAAALEWMDLQAMRRGVRPVDRAWVDSLYAGRMAAAQALESAGDLPGAFARYRSLAADVAGLRDTADAAARARALERSRAVVEAAAKAERLAERDREYQERLRAFLARVRSASRPPDLAKAVAELEIERLRREATDADPASAQAARRLLESTFILTAFYEPRDYLQRGDHRRALAVLDIAQAVKPSDASVCYSRARVYVALRRPQDALRALDCATAGGSVSAARLESDSTLAPLRGESAFRALVERVRGSERPR
jgi:predicted esterase